MITINKFLMEANNKHLLFLDLDQVLTDFDKAIKKFGKGSIEELEKKSPGLVWKLIAKAGESFWSDMDWTVDGKDLWSFAKKYHPIILSAPLNDKASRTGKAVWVKRELGAHVKLILAKSKDKHHYATKNGILVDDRKDNIDDWIKAGGIGILHTDSASTIKRLKEIL